MLLLKLWNYVRGYVIILVEGYFLEKFVNICIRRQILLWDIKSLKNSSMVLCVSIKGFKMLRQISRKTGCKVKILKKKGLPFKVHRYKGRKTFFLGAAVFVALFYFMTSFIWTIEITGNQTVDTELIMQKLIDLGVKPGVLKYGINPERISNTIMMDVNKLSWVSVVVKGTKMKVEVAEAYDSPPMVPKDTPCNIVATRDGVIKSIFVKAGIEAVKTGDTVKKGQLLISGTIPVKNQEDNPRIVHAIGVVNARTWYESRQPVETKIIEKVRTGNSKDCISILVFDKRVGLFGKKVVYNDYDKVEMKKLLSIGEDLVFPFGVIVDRYYENETTYAEYSLEDAKMNAAKKAYREIMEQLPDGARMTNRDVSFKEAEDGSITADVIIECIEDIGMTTEIGGK
ncbi:MAG: sporulation protein YqfD [Clostridiaceae bacterium]|nr:sporulation protein YqfD [Clostridiaceae bacterium]